MQLPGRLRSTTLGDLLGTLHRSRSTGTLELAEDRGRRHRVHLSGGMIVAVEYDGAAATLAEVLRAEGAVDDQTLKRSLLRAMTSSRLHGDVLVTEFSQAAKLIESALRRQLSARLQRIEQLPDAQVLFRVTVRPPRGALQDAPLGPREFLPGRKRARDRSTAPPGSSRRRTPAPPPVDLRQASAWQVLGVTPGADATEIKRAYRRLVRVCHPDLHPGATESERRSLSERFAKVTDAYRALSA